MVYIDFEFSWHTRNNILRDIDGTKFDVAIIGGGITGAGIANILAENGISTVLIDQNDFASGTSSGSSKLIHGGLRYLQQGRILEVYHLLKERNYLLKNTDIVKKLNFRILTGKNMWNTSEIRFGLFLYNIMSGYLHLPHFVKNNGEYKSNISGYFNYYDGVTVDSELVIYNIVSAFRHGAACLNYCKLIGASKHSGNYSLEIENVITGKNFKVHSFIVINAAGPWGNTVSYILGAGTVKNFHLSRGIHIVFPSELWNDQNAVVVKSAVYGRQLFIIPAGKVVYTGTTDNFVDAPDSFSVPEGDIKYLINSIKPLFPQFTEDKIIYSFAGIRVLIGSGSNPGKITRDFSIGESDRIITVLGGKITDYRIAARKTAKIVGNLMGKKLKIKNMPYTDYSRNKEDVMDNILMHECPVKIEDVIRRRIAASIYDPEQLPAIINRLADTFDGE